MAGAERVLEDRSFVYKQFFGRRGAGRKKKGVKKGVRKWSDGFPTVKRSRKGE